MKKKTIIISLISIFFILCSTPISALSLDESISENKDIVNSENEIEKWAVIAGYGWRIYSDVDAVEMRDTLVANGWQEDHIMLLEHWDATRNNIINGIRWMDDMEDENDIVLFFFSGHGGFRKIFTYNPAGWPEYQILHSFELRREFNKLESTSMTLIFDTCLAGSMVPSSIPSVFITNKNQIFENVNLVSKEIQTPYFSEIDVGSSKTMVSDLSGDGRVILMASGNLEYSYASFDLENGVFSYYLIEAFSGSGDLNQDGWVTAEEAFNYAKPKTIAYTKDAQHPKIYDNHDGEIKITDLGFPLYLQSILITEAEILKHNYKNC